MANTGPHDRRFHAFALIVIAAIALVAGVSAQMAKNRMQLETTARDLTQGDASRAPEIFRRYGCTGCHTIPGIAGADGQVGGPLLHLRQRVYIAGVANNTADNLVRWIVSPQSLSPKTAMPASGISEKEARDLAAYLYSH